MPIEAPSQRGFRPGVPRTYNLDDLALFLVLLVLVLGIVLIVGGPFCCLSGIDGLGYCCLSY